MKSLETRVREALINQATDELVQHVTEHPEYKSMLFESVEELMSSVISLIASASEDETNPGEITEIVKELRETHFREIQVNFNDPKKLRKGIYESTKKQYISLRELKMRLKSEVTDLREGDEVSEDVVAKYEKAHENLFQCAKVSDEFVRRLTKIAETRGVEEITRKETKYIIIREMFPTPEAYRSFLQNKREAERNFFQQAQSALMKDGELGQVLGSVLGVMQRMMEKAEKMAQRIEGDYMEKKIQEVYGKTNPF